ncbi:IgGFc-binding protein-like [Liolophura sinensis]|uniref:IgGFc-binding protein-like n=1 Tax=Liolophura sinensis TaxID=3198878 RepID=UPI003157FD37
MALWMSTDHVEQRRHTVLSRSEFPDKFWNLLLILIFSCQVVVESKGEFDYLAVFLPQDESARFGGFNLLEISAKQDTVVFIEVPYLNLRDTYTIYAGKPKTFSYPNRLRTALQEFHSKKAVHIRSSRRVTIKGMNALATSADSFLALPITQDFTHFRTISYTQSNVIPRCVLTITSLLGKNSVNIASTRQAFFRYRERYYRNGETLRIKLDGLEVVQVESYDVTGLLVTSYTPVAVYSGCNCVSVPRFSRDCDHIVEQMPPLTTWGTEFVSGAITPRQSGEIFRVLSSCNATQLRVNGHGYGAVNEGEFLEFKSKALDVTRIECSNPCLVALFIQGNSVDNRAGDPAMTVLPHTGQWVSSVSVSWSIHEERQTEVSRILSPMTHYVMVITKSAHKAGILMDGKVLGTGRRWTGIPNTNYSVSVFLQDLGKHQIQHINPRIKFGLISYGLGAGVSYAHPGDLDLEPNPARGCKITNIPGPADLRSETLPDVEVQRYDNLPVVISLACLCVVLVAIMIFSVKIILRLRRSVLQLQRQEKIIIVPRSNRAFQPTIDRNVSTAPYNGSRGVNDRLPVTPPPYIEILDDP